MSNLDDLFECGLSSMLPDPEARIAALEEEVVRRGELLREQDEELDRLEQALKTAEQEAASFRRRVRDAVRWAAGCLGAGLVLGLREPLCRMGWNLFRTVTDTLGIPQKTAVGALTAALTLAALWMLGRWMLRELLKEMEEES